MHYMGMYKVCTSMDFTGISREYIGVCRIYIQA